MNNVRECISNKIKELGFKIGCYDNNLDTLFNKTSLNQVLDNLWQEYTDIFLTIEDKLYIVELSTLDNEKDLKLFTGVEYFNRYGNLEDALDNEDITQEQYEEIKCTLY